MQIIENQDILSYCLSLSFGEQRNFYIGETVTGIPDNSCKYSYGNCRKLNNTFAQMSIYPRSNGGIIYTNTFNGTSWDGWRKGISDKDLAYSFKDWVKTSTLNQGIGSCSSIGNSKALFVSISALLPANTSGVPAGTNTYFFECYSIAGDLLKAGIMSPSNARYLGSIAGYMLTGGYASAIKTIRSFGCRAYYDGTSTHIGVTGASNSYADTILILGTGIFRVPS